MSQSPSATAKSAGPPLPRRLDRARALADQLPASVVVLGAMVAALTFKGAATLGVLPAVATFLDLPLAWLALAVALVRARSWSPLARRMAVLLAALVASVAVAWIVHPAEVLRPVVFIVLLGEPFAIVTALLIDPPSPRLRRAIEIGVVTLLMIQIPVAAWQWLHFGAGDPVQGTLYGAAAGAHVISAVAAVGGLWLLASESGRRHLRIVAAVCLFAIPFVADAKQVVFAMPAVLAGLSFRRIGRRALILIAPVLVSLLLLVLVYEPGRAAFGILKDAASGKGGKQVTVEIVWDEITRDPLRFAFGLGPAQTVSRAAYMTTDLFLREDSPLRSLGLAPARVAIVVSQRALEVSFGGTSFDSGVSSAIGVLGDLGVVGLVVYGWLLGTLFLALRRTKHARGMILAGAWAMFALLGFIFDWWEQPPFSVVLAVLSALALTDVTEVLPDHGPGGPEYVTERVSDSTDEPS